MPGPLLYSTNCWIKYHVQVEFRRGQHYVWCSSVFDSAAQHGLSSNRMLAPSSCPARIYSDLRTAVDNNDRHCAKIIEQRSSMLRLAQVWKDANEIDDGIFDELCHLAEHSEISYFRPLLYVIPRQTVDARLQRVPPEKRAGVAEEFILTDLSSSEFDIIEFAA